MSPFFGGYLADRNGVAVASATQAPGAIASGCRTLTVAFPADTVFDSSTTRLLLEVNVVSAQTINGFVLGYKLQVSPAPAVATFNDVPTSDFGFQYIEALAASGITGGGGGGNYCPDNPVTRKGRPYDAVGRSISAGAGHPTSNGRPAAAGNVARSAALSG